jgi:hypothetical protein
MNGKVNRRRTIKGAGRAARERRPELAAAARAILADWRAARAC